MSAAAKRSFAALSIRNYRLYFGGQLASLAGNWMQIVAELWLILSSPAAAPRSASRPRCSSPASSSSALSGGSLADRFDKRKLLIVTQALMAAPALALFGLLARGLARDLDRLRADRGPRPRARRRQPGPAGVRDRDRRPRPGRQRRLAQQRPRPLGPDHRPGDRRRPDRDLGRDPVLRAQRAHLRRDDRRADADAARRSCSGPSATAAKASGSARPCSYVWSRSGAADAAAADGGARHARLQLPGDHAAAGPLHASAATSPPTRC